jgi:hypothetical protein
MKKSVSSLFSILFILIALGFLYISMMPHWTSKIEEPLAEFSTERALQQVEAISQTPHYVGSKNHEKVALYIQKELHSLGLETSIQEGYNLTDWGNLVKSKNILARIKGTANSKALVLLSHYDSAPHSYSRGASDAGSGVATILESIRAFKYSKKKHKNDIIILFTDAEELGLNGAALFVTQHKWAKEVGLVLNFEARGTSGPSYMLMETNNGNAGLVKEFAAAKAPFPVTNSLMYSIYKMLPNDTDLTVFREKGNIQGYNFAFIDGHFNYHTAQDDLQHLDKNTLAHQGSYLMPLLSYFSNANLNTPKSADDDVYFSIPFTIVHYPFNWVLPMALLAFVLLLLFVFLGVAKKLISFPEISKGFIPIVASLFTSGLLTYLGWKALLLLYPQYNDLLNGFTYNGHDYIAAFVLLSLAICFGFYSSYTGTKRTMSYSIAPLFIWTLINIGLAVFLKGAGFLIIPLYFGIFGFSFFVTTQKSSLFLNLLLGVPALFIITPFIQMFPIGLGLKLLFGSAILTVICFGLLIPIFGTFTKKRVWSIVFLFLSIGFFVKAHLNSGYEPGKAKSNSLLYVYDSDSQKANWVTYDLNLDTWTKNYLGTNPSNAGTLNNVSLFSKYNNKFTYAAPAPLIQIAKPTITFKTDSIAGANRFLKIKISPNRTINRYDIYANEKMILSNVIANGARQLDQKGTNFNRKGSKVLSYYVVNNEPLEIQFSIPRNTTFDMELLESSFDLMTNPDFNMKKRAAWMMPTPFVLTDAIVLKQHIKPSAVLVEKPIAPVIQKPIRRQKIAAIIDTTLVH